MESFQITLIICGIIIFVCYGTIFIVRHYNIAVWIAAAALAFCGQFVIAIIILGIWSISHNFFEPKKEQV